MLRLIVPDHCLVAQMRVSLRRRALRLRDLAERLSRFLRASVCGTADGQAGSGHDFFN